MFKGAIKVAGHSAISNKDRKKLKKDLSKNFPTDVIDTIFINTGEISATKLQNSPIILYSDEEFPMFVDSTSNGDFFPTIYTVDAYPDICRSLTLKEGVESFVMKGANLMWPGVDAVDDLSNDMLADSVVCVRKNDGTVIAVGALACDAESVKNGAKAEGIASYVLHIEGDSLWKAGGGVHPKMKWDRASQEAKEQEQLAKLQKKRDKKGDDDDDEGDLTALLASAGTGGALPTDMTKGKIKHMPKELKMKDTPKDTGKGKGPKDTKPAKDSKDAKDAKGTKDAKDAKAGKKEKKEKEKKEKKANKKKRGDDESGSEGSEQEEAHEQEEMDEKKPATNMDDEDSEDWKNAKKGKGVKKDKKTTKVDEKEEEGGNTKEQMKEMDDKIMEAFLNSVKISLTDKELPIELGKFWTNHIIKCKTEDNDELDFKLSSHKKIGKFFQILQKDKMLTYEEASKKNPVPKVTKIDFYCQRITQWTPTVTAKDLERRTSKDDEKGGQQKESWRVPIEIVKLYKPHDSIKNLIDGHSEPATKVDLEKKFLHHLKENGWLEKDLVIYSDELYEKFGVIEEEEDEESDNEEGGMAEKKGKTKTRKGERELKVHRNRLLDAFFKKVTEVYEIRNTKDKKVELKNTPFKNIQLIAEKAHNKFHTRLSGLEPFGVDWDKLSSHFQNKYATSCTLADLPGKNTGRELTLQGTFISEVEEFLTMEMGITEDLITQNNKLEKKKHKGGKMMM